MFIGYALALPHDQNLQLQKDVLTKAGCSKIYTSSAPDAATQRKELEKVLSKLRPGDTLVVWKLDRLGTSIKDLTATMLFLAEQGIGFKSLADNIDTSTKGGRQVFHIFHALRALMRERTKRGRRVARAKGRKGGRRKLLTASEIQELKELYNNKEIPIKEIRQKFHLARSTFYRYVKHTDKQQPGLRSLVHRLRGLGER
jgi:DNA invertase Pin-like site-specific DNA recombinase